MFFRFILKQSWKKTYIYLFICFTCKKTGSQTIQKFFSDLGSSKDSFLIWGPRQVMHVES